MDIRGWCFSDTGEAITAIRLRAGGITLQGVIGLPRPDVKAALAAAPHDSTGFEIHGTLPRGELILILEAKVANGGWHLLFTQKTKIPRQWWPLALSRASWTELMRFQMATQMVYPPREKQPERFPSLPREIPLPKLTIVTPSYQQGAFLEETLQSVLGSSRAKIEYVVQDASSSDHSLEIIQRFATASASKRPGNFIWESAADHGQADAIARGFSKTSGPPTDVMAWINSDDFYLPGALDFVAGYFAQHPEVDVLYGHRIVVNEKSQEIARWFLPKHDDAVLRLNDFVPQETMFWRRRIWDKVGGLDTSFKFAMDWDLLLRFQAAGARIVRVPYFLACFRVHPAQKTSSAMHDIGQKEITLLRERTHGRVFPPQELENDARLLSYLRKSAFIEFLWKLGLRAP